MPSSIPIRKRLEVNRNTWQNKAILRGIYADYYARMLKLLKSGSSLEIGAGSGHLNKYNLDITITDIQVAPWLNVTADAQALPFKDASFDNIIMLDALHHLENTSLFFSEAIRILKPRGRIIMIEPAITPISWLFYRFMHSEPVNMQQDPFAEVIKVTNRSPYDGNQALPTILFCRRYNEFSQRYPELKLSKVQYLSLFAYPLSGGYRNWSLMPVTFLNLFLRVEDHLLKLVGRLMAFRLLIMLERI